MDLKFHDLLSQGPNAKYGNMGAVGLVQDYFASINRTW